MANDQRRPFPCTTPLWRLLLGEVALLARRVGRWKLWLVLGVAFVCFLTVEVALSSATPGPALAEVWRWLVALAMTITTLFVWAILFAMRNERARDGS